MVPLANIVACVITLLMSIALPIAVLIVFEAKNKKQGIGSAWWLGAAGFFVTQILIRVPILSILGSQSWFIAFAQDYPFIYAFGLAFTAGLFELAGRFAIAMLMKKKLTWKRSLAAGLGHGGIEAMLIIGMTYVNNLIYIIMINSGYIDIIISKAIAAGADVSQLELVCAQLISLAPAQFLLAGFERLLTMTCHVAMSALVCYGVAHKKAGICALLCLGIHTTIDLTAGISLLLPQNIAIPVIYAILIVITVVSLVILKNLHSRWKKVF